jgi:hypothetical protein
VEKDFRAEGTGRKYSDIAWHIERTAIGLHDKSETGRREEGDFVSAMWNFKSFFFWTGVCNLGSCTC